MNNEQRDTLWEKAYETYYNSYFNEIRAELVVKRWKLLDNSFKILVALTATGSALASWTLWNLFPFNYVWSGLVSVSAILAIIHSTLSATNQVNAWSETKQFITSLRIDLETFMQKMDLDDNFPIDDFRAEYFEYRVRYKKAIELIVSDILDTEKLRSKAQDLLNLQIKHKFGDIIIE